MSDNERRISRQKLIRQKLIERATYHNKYDMKANQIQINQNNKNPVVNLVKRTRVLANKHKPLKSMRNKPTPKGLQFLLDVPEINKSKLTVLQTPEWFTSKEKAEVSVIIPLYKSHEVIEDLIDSWDLNDAIKTEIIFFDDNCPFNSKDYILNYWLKRKGELKRPIGKIIHNSTNQGFAMSCNIAARYATGNYLIFLNADTVVTTNWIQPITKLLRKEKVGIVGNLQIKQGGTLHNTIDGAGSEWHWEDNCFHHIGRHAYRGKKLSHPLTVDNCPKDLLEVSEREMVTGCCIAIKKDLFEEIGGFNPNFRVGYWEDSDICLTVREKGYKILYQPDSRIYHKLGHSNSSNHKYHEHNRNLFYNKWLNSGRIDPLIDTKRPNPKIKVETILLRRTAAHGDVLVAAAVAPALKERYPNCKIYFNTNCPEVLKDNPYIDEIMPNEKISLKAFQIYYNLDLAYELRPKTNFLTAYAEAVGVPNNQCSLFIGTEFFPDLPQNYVVVHAGKTSWVGRDWTPFKYDVMVNQLRKEGKFVVTVGTKADNHINSDLDLRGKTNIQQLAYVIQNAKLFVGIDSFPMHIAQTFDVPGLCFFGSVNPQTRLLSNNMKPVIAEGLSCLGCHNRQIPPCTVTNVCEIEIQDCINLVTVDHMAKKINLMMSN